MNIDDFKEGDVITRTEPAAGGDRSYQNDRLVFVGAKAGMIVVIRTQHWEGDHIVKLETDWWSEGWDFYPENLIARAEKLLVEIKKGAGSASKDDLS